MEDKCDIFIFFTMFLAQYLVEDIFSPCYTTCFNFCNFQELCHIENGSVCDNGLEIQSLTVAINTSILEFKGFLDPFLIVQYLDQRDIFFGVQNEIVFSLLRPLLGWIF